MDLGVVTMERLIDADALIQNHGNDVTNWDNPYAVKISSIEHAPTVDAVEVVRHGKWLEWFPGDCALIMTGEEMLYRCSSCDAKYADAEEYKYCPYCGARMDLEEV